MWSVDSDLISVPCAHFVSFLHIPKAGFARKNYDFCYVRNVLPISMCCLNITLYTSCKELFHLLKDLSLQNVPCNEEATSVTGLEIFANGLLLIIRTLYRNENSPLIVATSEIKPLKSRSFTGSHFAVNLFSIADQGRWLFRRKSGMKENSRHLHCLFFAISLPLNSLLALTRKFSLG